MKLNMAIIGHGFVGKAVDYGFNNPNLEKFIVDPIGGIKIEDLPQDTHIAFVCVPTPMSKDGNIDSTIIKDVVEFLAKNRPTTIIVIKSTVTPDIITELCDLNPSKIIYNPEFLTEKCANEDFVNPIMHVFGARFPGPVSIVEDFYARYSSCKPCPIFRVSEKDASFIKYGINSYLASKVLWFNQFYDVVTKNDGNFNSVIGAMTTDNRVGTSHTSVPGFDGKFGFGGACFPKDCLAFLKFAGQFDVLKEVIRSNNEYRSNSNLDEREKSQNIRFDLDV